MKSILNMEDLVLDGEVPFGITAVLTQQRYSMLRDRKYQGRVIKFKR
jgi:hypothetical protein